MIYEAPHRVRATVAELGAALGGERSLVVAREITKKFETIARHDARGSARLVRRRSESRARRVRARRRCAGGAGQRVGRRLVRSTRRRLLAALVGELPPARAARVAAAATGLPRDALYAQALRLKAPQRDRVDRAPSRTDARFQPPAADAESARAAPAGWDARLELALRARGARTVLAARQHVGPLRVQKALYPEGADVCQAIIVHPPGGIVGGDSLAIAIDAGAGAHAQLTTPGAAKWYRSAGSRRAIRQRRCASRPGALIEWLPQETIAVRRRAGVDRALASSSRRSAVHRLGRHLPRAHRIGRALRVAVSCASRSSCIRDGALVFCERAAIDGGASRAPIRCNPRAARPYLAR